LVEGPKMTLNGEEEKVTVPVGVVATPPLEVSITVAVQVDAWFTTTELGVQVIDVEVVRRLTVMLAGVVVELPLWVSPVAGTYVAFTLAIPEDVGVKGKPQLAVPTDVPTATVQLLPERKPPVTPALKEMFTVPVGVVGVPDPVSVTVAVQLEAWFTTTGVSQETDVVVDWAGVGEGLQHPELPAFKID